MTEPLHFFCRLLPPRTDFMQTMTPVHVGRASLPQSTLPLRQVGSALKLTYNLAPCLQ